MDGVHLFQILKYYFRSTLTCSGTYRLVKSERLLVPAKFLSCVQVQAVLSSMIYLRNILLCLIENSERDPDWDGLLFVLSLNSTLNCYYIINATRTTNKQPQQSNATTSLNVHHLQIGCFLS